MAGRTRTELFGTGPRAELANRLRTLRDQRGFTLRQMAAKSGYSLGTLSAAENCRRTPTWEVTETIVQCCGADPREWRQLWEFAARSPSDDADRLAGPERGSAQDLPETDNRLATSWADQATTQHDQRRAPRTGRPSSLPLGRRLGVAASSAIAVGALVLVFTVTLSGMLPKGHARQRTGRSSELPTGTAPASIDANRYGVLQPIRRIGTIMMTPGQVIDLDTAKADWSLTQAPKDNPFNLEFTLANHSLTGIDQAVLAVLAQGASQSFHGCASQQAYGVELDPQQIRPGGAFCVITDQRRYALLQIADVLYSDGHEPVRIVLDARVWEPRTAT